MRCSYIDKMKVDTHKNVSVYFFGSKTRESGYTIAKTRQRQRLSLSKELSFRPKYALLLSPIHT